MEFVILFGALVVGAYAGWQLREYYAIRQVAKLLKNTELVPPILEKEPRTKMRLERHSDVIYAYSEEDGSFIAQGKDLEALDDAIQSRFPERKFSVQEQNLIDIKAEYHESV